MSKQKKISLTEWLGFRKDTIREDTRWLGAILGNLLTSLGLILLCLFIAMLVLLVMAMFSQDDKAEDVRNIGLVLAAIIGAPFLVWRSYIAAKQVNIADESLFNDKINAAATDLAARRQVTTVLGKDDERSVITEWKDDLVTRAAAIDRLEGLANERPETAPRIARMLSIYVRELSAEHPAKDHKRGAYLTLIEAKGLSPAQAMAQLEMEPGQETVKHVTAWAHALKPIRSDMEKAAQTLGRLKDIPDIDPDEIAIDLRDANLQGFDLNNLTFKNTLMTDARMEGANFFQTRMEGANLREARMEGALFTRARMERANLSEARMEGASLFHARIEGANLSGARMEGADLREARMEEAYLSEARMEGAYLREARMEGANLFRARMKGADLSRARIDESTNFSSAVVQYAAVKLTPLIGKGID